MTRYIFALVLILSVVRPAWAVDAYQGVPYAGQTIGILAYPPPGRGYCDGATNVMALIIPNVVAGDVLQARSVFEVTIPWASRAVAASAIHIEPWTGAIQPNSAMPCNEHWLGEDVDTTTAQTRPYTTLEQQEVWVAPQNYPAGVLVLVRAYGGSAFGTGYFEILYVQGTDTGKLTVLRWPAGAGSSGGSITSSGPACTVPLTINGTVVGHICP